MRTKDQAPHGASMRHITRVQFTFAVLAAIVLTSTQAVSSAAVTGIEPGPRHERVAMDDGVELDGWVWVPDAARDERVPTVLVFSDYWGNADSSGNAPPPSPITRVGDVPVALQRVPSRRMLDEGYALALFNVRGSGDSGGCFGWLGDRDARDGAALVAWLAARPWSDGRVGMTGQSFDASTAIATATLAPPALDAVVAVAPVVDAFIYAGTPNGVLGAAYSTINYPLNAAISAPPPVYRSADGAPYDDPAWAAAWPARALERACPDSWEAIETSLRDPHRDHRNKAWYDERRFTDGFGNIRAAVLTTLGFGDTTIGGFGIDAIGWDLLRSPKSMILGQWGHNPPPNGPQTAAGVQNLEEEHPPPYGNWEDTLVAWFDHYLKQQGPQPDGVSKVRYQTDDNAWHETREWPADTAKVVSLGNTARSFRSAVQWTGSSGVPFCADDGLTALAYEGDPVTTPAEMAGAGFAYLRLSSDQPAGQVGVQLLELAPGFSCEANPDPGLVKFISWGAADLRFYDGSFDAEPFPIHEPRDLRIDLESAAQAIQPGNRLAVIVSNGDPSLWNGQTDVDPGNAQIGVDSAAPTITVHPESHVVLPLTKGSLGGTTRTYDYPPRPNLPSDRR